jgi:hypothetical protein
LPDRLGHVAGGVVADLGGGTVDGRNLVGGVVDAGPVVVVLGERLPVALPRDVRSPARHYSLPQAAGTDQDAREDRYP